MKFKISLFSVCLFIAACASLPLDNPTFQSQNRPVRTLNTLIVYDSRYSLDQIKDVVASASDSLEQQVGIKFHPTFIQHDLPCGYDDTLDYLYGTYKDSSYDNIVGFMRKRPDAILAGELIGGWLGVTDDDFRRYTVMSTASAHILIHETGHTFIFSHGHSLSGVMIAAGIKILPGTPIIAPDQFNEKDRLEVLSNKWRNFKEQPPLSKHLTRDEIQKFLKEKEKK